MSKEIEAVLNIHPQGIRTMEDKSDKDNFMKRLKITFTNGLAISIIQGKYSYGGNEGFYEVAPYDLTGNMNGSLLGIVGDDVEGWLTAEEVSERCNRLMCMDA